MFDIYNGEITFCFIKKMFFGLTYPSFRLKNISLFSLMFTLMLQNPNLVIIGFREVKFFFNLKLIKN